MHVLITAATREIAEAIGAGLVERGMDAETRPIDDVTDLVGYDAVVLGSAVYMGRWLKPAREFAGRNVADLGAVPVWLFSSGPLGDPGHLIPEGEPAEVAELTELTGALGHCVFAGRLDRAKLGVLETATVRALHAPEGDYRQWDAIRAFAEEIAKQLCASSVGRRARGGGPS